MHNAVEAWKIYNFHDHCSCVINYYNRTLLPDVCNMYFCSGVYSCAVLIWSLMNFNKSNKLSVICVIERYLPIRSLVGFSFCCCASVSQLLLFWVLVEWSAWHDHACKIFRFMMIESIKRKTFLYPLFVITFCHTVLVTYSVVYWYVFDDLAGIC